MLHINNNFRETKMTIYIFLGAHDLYRKKPPNPILKQHLKNMADIFSWITESQQMLLREIKIATLLTNIAAYNWFCLPVQKSSSLYVLILTFVVNHSILLQLKKLLRHTCKLPGTTKTSLRLCRSPSEFMSYYKRNWGICVQ